MRKYFSNILFALVAVFAAGCVEVDIYPVEPQTPATVTLQLRNTDLVATRVVDVTDDSQCNEDLIENVQCFFTNSTNADQIIYRSGKIELAENTKGSATITLQDIPANILSSIAKVYVVANYAGDLTQETTIAAIKAKDITLGTGSTQASFVMDGTNKNPLTLSGTTISGSVDLERVAAKIVVKANINGSIKEGGVTWTPVPSGIKMTCKGGIVASKISALTEANTIKTDGYTQVPVTGEYPSTVFTEDRETSTTAKYVGYQTVPFYSFPVAAGTESKGEITMTIPWTTGTGDNAVTIEYAYEIPVEIAFERNKVYIIDIDVEVLGNLEGKKLTPSYIVLNWKDTPINATLSKPQYLVVDQNYVVMNNVENISVGYASSDEVKVEIIDNSIANNIYSTSNNKTYNAVFGDLGVTNNSNTITLTHSLDNTRTQASGDPATRYDYKAQTFVVRVSHVNNSDIYQDITFVQYPAMYVLSESLLSGTTNNNVMVNANDYDDSDVDYNYPWMSVAQTPSKGTDIYTISVTAFDNTTADYVICDPRADAINITNFPKYDREASGWGDNRTSIGAISVQADVTGDNEITGYRPTITGSAATNFVAPEFKVASSCGTYKEGDSRIYLNTSGYYRCAGYQEAGYPAGRWRIPTPAELNVIGRLCSEGKIASIFVDGVVYMSSDGPYSYNERNGGTFTKSDAEHSGSIRCVYDSWYWTDKVKDTKNFVWAAEGDTAKSKYLVSVE